MFPLTGKLVKTPGMKTPKTGVYWPQLVWRLVFFVSRPASRHVERKEGGIQRIY
jgi:hypothetical protein